MQTTIRLWALADTHLSLAKPKDMGKFGERWQNHIERIAIQWRMHIQPHDIVLLPGDVSWASSPNRVHADLAWLHGLPGQKILLRGNHDHWWHDINRVRKIIEPWCFYALEGDSLILDDVIICGAMGHIAPEDPYYVADPKKDRYTRELMRLESALQHAISQRKANEPIILMMHYPPFTSDGKPTAFVDLITNYQPTICLYGHLHRSSEWQVARHGNYKGVEYRLVAADFLEMTPTLVWTLQTGS